MIYLKIFCALLPFVFGALGFSYLQTIGGMEDDIEKVSGSVDTMISKLESSMEKKIDAVDDDMSRVFFTANSNLNDLESELEGKIARLEDKLDKLTSELTQSKSDTEKEKTSTEAIKGEVSEVKSEVDEVDDKVVVVEGEVVVVKGAVEKVQDDVKVILTDIDDTSKAIQTVKNALINSFSYNKELLRQLTDERLSDLQPPEFFSNEPTAGAAMPDTGSGFKGQVLEHAEEFGVEVSGRKSIADHCQSQSRLSVPGMSISRCYDIFLKRYEQIQIGETDEQ